MTSQVLHNNVEATYITVESTTFYGVKKKPSKVLVNSQDAPFTYRANQVRSGVNGLTHTKKKKLESSVVLSHDELKKLKKVLCYPRIHCHVLNFVNNFFKVLYILLYILLFYLDVFAKLVEFLVTVFEHVLTE